RSIPRVRLCPPPRERPRTLRPVTGLTASPRERYILKVAEDLPFWRGPSLDILAAIAFRPRVISKSARVRQGLGTSVTCRAHATQSLEFSGKSAIYPPWRAP